MPSSPSPKPLPTIALGHGPVELEAFLEPTCPHSKRAFGKFPALLDAVGEDRLTINFDLVAAVKSFKAHPHVI